MYDYVYYNTCNMHILYKSIEYYIRNIMKYYWGCFSPSPPQHNNNLFP